MVRSAASRRRAAQGQRTGARGTHVKSMQLGSQAKPENRDVFQDDLFNVNAKQKFSDKYEDEVFNVSNLPRPERRPRQEQRPARRSEETGSPQGGAQRTNRRR